MLSKLAVSDLHDGANRAMMSMTVEHKMMTLLQVIILKDPTFDVRSSSFYCRIANMDPQMISKTREEYVFQSSYSKFTNNTIDNIIQIIYEIHTAFKYNKSL